MHTVELLQMARACFNGSSTMATRYAVAAMLYEHLPHIKASRYVLGGYIQEHNLFDTIEAALAPTPAVFTDGEFAGQPSVGAWLVDNFKWDKELSELAADAYDPDCDDHENLETVSSLFFDNWRFEDASEAMELYLSQPIRFREFKVDGCGHAHIYLQVATYNDLRPNWGTPQVFYTSSEHLPLELAVKFEGSKGEQDFFWIPELAHVKPITELPPESAPTLCIATDCRVHLWDGKQYTPGVLTLTY